MNHQETKMPDLRPADIDQELIDAGADVLRENGLWGAWEHPQTHEGIRDILAAVLPLYDQKQTAKQDTHDYFFILTIQWTEGANIHIQTRNALAEGIRAGQTEEEIFQLVYNDTCTKNGAPTGRTSVSYWYLARNDRRPA